MQFISLDLAANLTVLTLANSCGKGVEVPPTCTIQNDVLMTATLTEKGLYNCQGRVIQVSDSNLLTWRFRAPTNVYAGRKCFFVNLFSSFALLGHQQRNRPTVIIPIRPDLLVSFSPLDGSLHAHRSVRHLISRPWFGFAHLLRDAVS